ncbi:hypothetical protein PanWU01x14_016110 [Parasponia andersonii]|uniref:Uncharacterized protein n=1 Tax=Parasponia andersonii TaxID=3476 RepID=A0A2P5E0M7_PARAD|nr:hypothetical protein PanWU01x14_016110 [Parasponia andersonii]
MCIKSRKHTYEIVALMNNYLLLHGSTIIISKNDSKLNMFMNNISIFISKFLEMTIYCLYICISKYKTHAFLFCFFFCFSALSNYKTVQHAFSVVLEYTQQYAIGYNKRQFVSFLQLVNARIIFLVVAA